jgi:hypothetical protein
MAESINIVCHVKMKGKTGLINLTLKENKPKYNYRGNFRKKGLINDDDSHHNRKCGVCVYIKGHRLHSTAATPQATIIDRAETRLDQATTILDQKRHC